MHCIHPETAIALVGVAFDAVSGHAVQISFIGDSTLGNLIYKE